MQTKENTNYSGLDELIYGEEMRNYNRHIVQMAIRHAGKIKKCVDFGAGIGTLSLIFREQFGIAPLCVEIDAENISWLKKRKLDFAQNLEDIPNDIDLIFSSNVLEHIEDDVAIKKIHYADSVGFLASLSMKLFGYKPDSGIGSPGSLRFYDKYLFPISKFMDNLGFKYILGKNLVVIAQKT